MNSWINLTALWQIVVVGLIAGAGLPALFAVGLRALGMSGGRAQPADGATDADSEQIVGGSVAGTVLAVLCFAVVVAAIGWAIYFIVSSG